MCVCSHRHFLYPVPCFVPICIQCSHQFLHCGCRVCCRCCHSRFGFFYSLSLNSGLTSMVIVLPPKYTHNPTNHFNTQHTAFIHIRIHFTPIQSNSIHSTPFVCGIKCKNGSSERGSVKGSERYKQHTNKAKMTKSNKRIADKE